MIGSKFNFIISAAIFASTIYFLWIKIKRNTKLFKKDDSDKCLKNKDEESIDNQSEIQLNETQDISSQSEDENSEEENVLESIKNEVYRQIEESQMNFDNIEDSDIDLSNNISIMAVTCLDKSTEEMLCNNLRQININTHDSMINNDDKNELDNENSNVSESVDLEINQKNMEINEYLNEKEEESKEIIENVINEIEKSEISTSLLEEHVIEESKEETQELNVDKVENDINEMGIEEISKVEYVKSEESNVEITENEIILTNNSEILTNDPEDEERDVNKVEVEDVELIEESCIENENEIPAHEIEEGEIIDESCIEEVEELNKDDEKLTVEENDVVEKDVELNEELCVEMKAVEVAEEIKDKTDIVEQVDQINDVDDVAIIDESMIEMECVQALEEVEEKENSVEEKEDGEIIDESFVENQDIQEEEKREESSEDITENEVITTETQMEENEEGEIIDESFVENQDIQVEEEKREESNEEIIVNEVVATEHSQPPIEEKGEIIDKSLIENQDIQVEEEKREESSEDITENEVVATETQIEEGEIIDESFVEERDDVLEEENVIDNEENNVHEENVIDKEENDVHEEIDEKTNNQPITVEDNCDEVAEKMEETHVNEIEQDCPSEIDKTNVEKDSDLVNNIDESMITEDSLKENVIDVDETSNVESGIHDMKELDVFVVEETNTEEGKLNVDDVVDVVDVMDHTNTSANSIETEQSVVTDVNELEQTPLKESDDTSSDISQTSDYLNDSSLDSLIGGGSLMEFIEDCLSGKKSDTNGDNESTSKLENWPNDEDSMNNIKRDFYDVSNNVCSPQPSSESDHAHCFNNLTERVAILSAESILDNHGHINSSDSERTPILSSPSFDDCNPELYVEKITYGDKELDIVYFDESVLEEGGVQADVQIIRTIPVGWGGRIIGKKGKTKNELMKKFGAQLLIYNHPEEIGKQVLQITCNPSVKDQLEKWVNKTLEQITKSTIQTTVSNPEWLKPMIPLGKLVAAHIVDMSTIQHIKLRIYDPDIIKSYNVMQQEMNADYAGGDSTSILPRPVAIGCVCVAMIRPDYFLRAQIIDIYEDYVWVYLFDLGKICQTYLFYLYKIREKYMKVPFQVIPARLSHALVKNKNITPAIIYKRFLCDQKTKKPKMVRVFFPRMNTCCEPCVNIYIPMSTLSDSSSSNSTNNDEFVDLLELLVSMDVCSMVRETVNSDIQVKINSNHFKAFLNEKDRKQIANITVPLYFQPCNNKFYEDYIEFKGADNETT